MWEEADIFVPECYGLVKHSTTARSLLDSSGSKGLILYLGDDITSHNMERSSNFVYRVEHCCGNLL
uniref:Uncharacterized protein n=1 Tax=Timema cristinae TaxID=61476 RepID=A0A7R9D5D9_TIMCR|nr:unnamed protein product [Timema cristinae]